MLIPTLSPRGQARFGSATVIDPSHPQRAEVEAFIAGVYAEKYGAQLRSFLPELLAFRRADGELQAAVGIRRAQDAPLFVEQYLDASAEATLATSRGIVARRDQLVEVGNFAAMSPGDARELIVQLTGILHAAGSRWVLFAATRQLRNAFDRLHLGTVELAPARRERLRDDQTEWGRYYESNPCVLFGDIAAGHAFLRRSAEDPGQAVAPVRPHAFALAHR
ncbi:MAG: thermostable hemolysin [Arenimonas sp.]|nr:thermostable hemolysin [Arenimonas sp.]